MRADLRMFIANSVEFPDDADPNNERLQEGQHQSLQFLLSNSAELAMNGNPLSIEDDGIGKPAQAVAGLPSEIYRLGIAHQNRVVDLHLGSVWTHLVSLIDGDADNLQTFGAQLLLYFDERRDFLAAGAAPCGPEVHDQHLAPPLIQSARLALEIRNARGHEPGRSRGGWHGGVSRLPTIRP